MNILGIESTAHTYGVGIITDKAKILANQKDMFKPGVAGIHPRLASEHHAEVSRTVLQNALKEANLTMEDIDLIGYSQGPGLPPCLHIGAVSARTLSLIHNIPLIGVNHCVSHIEIGRALTKAKDPVFLYVSGANTQVISKKSGRYRVFGETLDIGVGNMLDVIGRNLGLEFPAGPKIEQLALKGKKLIPLPYSVKGMDMSFSGLINKIEQIKKKHSIEDICYSLQETVFAMLLEVSERAMSNLNKKELLIGGGVGANKKLNEMAKTMCKQRGAKFYETPKMVCVDNGVMIAWNAYLAEKNVNGFKPILKDYRTDEVDIIWK